MLEVKANWFKKDIIPTEKSAQTIESLTPSSQTFSLFNNL